MKLSLSGIAKRGITPAQNAWPQKIEFSAQEIKRDSIGEPYKAPGSRDLIGYIVLEKTQYENLMRMDEIVQAGLYSASASLNHAFMIFSKDGKPTDNIATLSTAGKQSLTSTIDGREFRADLSIRGQHPTLTGEDRVEPATTASNRKKASLVM